ncbi:hypothetical protein B4U79_00598 [Dinothrombium tinctorium]|uniref:Uncharacterized protein n=1 Tax=Dinothrombium tinctorium TaxID=1965070 RepID=A0A443QT67_9ACAR|nr:hypothetical protein B4U79_00598 [Dinothrombium tinctorium]
MDIKIGYLAFASRLRTLIRSLFPVVGIVM